MKGLRIKKLNTSYNFSFKDHFYFIAILFSYFILMPPAYIKTLDLFNKYDMPIRFLVVLCIGGFYIVRGRISSTILLIIAYLSISVISTFSQMGDLLSAIWGNLVVITALCMITEIAFWKNASKFLKYFYYYWYILIIINIISLLIWPEGMYIDLRGIQKDNYFLGNYNSFIKYAYLAIISGYISLKEMGKKFHFLFSYILLWFLSLFFVLKVHSTTSCIGLIFLALFLLAFNTYFWKSLFCMTNYIIFNTVFFILIVAIPENCLFKWITALLNKDITFTGRTYIWENAINWFKSYLILGNGIEPNSIITEKLGNVYAAHAHNLYLNIAYQTGILGVIIFSFIFIVFICRIRTLKNIKVKGMLTSTVFCILLMSQFEAYSLDFMLIYITFIITYCNIKGSYRSNENTVHYL